MRRQRLAPSANRIVDSRRHVVVVGEDDRRPDVVEQLRLGRSGLDHRAAGCQAEVTLELKYAHAAGKLYFSFRSGQQRCSSGRVLLRTES